MNLLLFGIAACQLSPANMFPFKVCRKVHVMFGGHATRIVSELFNIRSFSVENLCTLVRGRVAQKFMSIPVELCNCQRKQPDAKIACDVFRC